MELDTTRIQRIKDKRLPHIYPIHVHGRAGELSWSNLVPVLERLFPVKFSFVDEAVPDAAAEIETAGNLARSRNPESSGIFRMPQPKEKPADGNLFEISVRFTDELEVPFPFRGRTVQVKVAAQPVPLSLRDDAKVLATCGMNPVWVVAKNSDVKYFESAFDLSGFGPNPAFKDTFNERRFMEMLPLLCWLREICRQTANQNPPLRACFIFDDPNLHWPRYGFIDFRKMAEHAAKKNYHATFATIPLDGWFIHGATARLFRDNARRLSLAVHGNDHIKQELARDYAPSARKALLWQATHRIERLESKAGLPVCRVMVPPHGACSEKMLAELPGCGFEAACISHGSLRAHNQGKSWTKDVGYFPSELVRGCPALPRWGLSGDVENAILLAAFLGQPMILRGHHQDLKNGIELLDDLAEFINRLGPVTWSNLTSLSRMNYQWRMEGDTFRAKPFGRKLVLKIPDEASQLVVEAGIQTDWDISGLNGDVIKARVGEPVSLLAVANREILIATPSSPIVRFRNERSRMPVIAFARRLLTEGRDRLLPFSLTQ